jgi:hypothetical protein
MDHPLPWLRYLDAADLDDQAIDFDGLKVRNAEKETLGHVEGFIVDSQSARPYYVVVDSGGWFKSKHYLMPVGYARMDDDNDALVVDLTKERIDRFPGFELDKFDKMGEAEIRRLNDDTCIATSTTAVSYSATEPFSSQWDRPQYAIPTWWEIDTVVPDRTGETGFSTGAEYPPSKVAPVNTGSTVTDRFGTEQVTAKADASAGARKPEDSPFFDGRAQPGDVLGLDTGGERTYVGDTAEDENKRRESAEETVRKDRK